MTFPVWISNHPNDCLAAGLVLLGALLLDLLLGDPRRMPHPVVGIGNLASGLEKLGRRLIRHELLAGFVTMLLLLAIVLSVAGGALWAAGLPEGTSGLLLSSSLSALFIWTTIALKSMTEHSRAVQTALADGDIKTARERTGWIVGRETDELNEDEIVRATVESVAESATDGISGPLFFALLGGLFGGPAGAALGALAFRVINTGDSMFGYRNERYLFFGRFAARLDDAAGFLPARVTPVFIMLAALFTPGARAKASWRIFRRDGSNHPSPNAGQCEAAFAGALGIQLGGTNTYHGKPVARPTIGDDLQKRAPEHITAANRLLVGTTLLFTAACAGLFFLLAFSPLGVRNDL